MCGRYASFLPAEAIARLVGTVKPLPDLAPFWGRHLDLLKWSLLPHWAKEPTTA
jgi:hypothetical protein